MNAAGIVGLCESVKWTIKNADKINAKISRLSGRLMFALKNMRNVEVYTPVGVDTGVISFNVKDADSTTVADILDKKYGIAVRAGLHCAPLIHNHLGTLEKGAVRISVGYNNKNADVEKLIDAIREISKS